MSKMIKKKEFGTYTIEGRMYETLPLAKKEAQKIKRLNREMKKNLLPGEERKLFRKNMLFRAKQGRYANGNDNYRSHNLPSELQFNIHEAKLQILLKSRGEPDLNKVLLKFLTRDRIYGFRTEGIRID